MEKTNWPLFPTSQISVTVRKRMERLVLVQYIHITPICVFLDAMVSIWSRSSNCNLLPEIQYDKESLQPTNEINILVELISLHFLLLFRPFFQSSLIVHVRTCKYYPWTINIGTVRIFHMKCSGRNYFCITNIEAANICHGKPKFSF